jgi:hypothetical protein
MLTIDTIVTHFEKVIATERLAGNAETLRRVQLAAGMIMDAAQADGDQDTAMRFRLLAAQAANKREEIEAEDK